MRLAAKSGLDGFSEMKGLPAYGLQNLLPATESRGDKCVFRRAAHCRQQYALADGLRHCSGIPSSSKSIGESSPSWRPSGPLSSCRQSFQHLLGSSAIAYLRRMCSSLQGDQTSRDPRKGQHYPGRPSFLPRRLASLMPLMPLAPFFTRKTRQKSRLFAWDNSLECYVYLGGLP